MAGDFLFKNGVLPPAMAPDNQISATCIGHNGSTIF